MPVSYRVLPPEEWDKLKDLPFGQGAAPNPNGALIIVAEDQEKIVGIWGAGSVILLDGLWVDEQYRGHTATGYHLFKCMMTALSAAGVPQAFTFTDIPEIHELANRFGFQDVGTFMMIDPNLAKD